MTALCNTLLGVSVAYALIWLFAESHPGGLEFVQPVMVLIGVLLGFAWLVLVVVAVVLRLGKLPTSGVRALAAAAAVMAVTVLLSLWSVPLRLRFEMSRSAFDRAVTDEAAATGNDPVDGREVPFLEDQRVGLYGVESASAVGIEVWFRTVEPWAPSSSGFIYAPRGAPGFLGLGTPWARGLSMGDGWYAYWPEPF